MKKRLDLLLVERELSPTRQKAQAMILAGDILVNDQKIDKPGHLVPEDARLRILGERPFVSRSGAKLEAALSHFGISVEGRTCADLGASTGGFTDCLLQHGAREVHTYDVGRGQLDWSLQSDGRVVAHDRYNVRYISGRDLPVGVSLVTADLSFISLTLVLGPVRDALLGAQRCSAEASEGTTVDLILLVKPQFEVGKGEVGKGGIVRDPGKRLQALESVESCARGLGFRVIGSIPSPVAGAKGNREFLLYLQLVLGLSSGP
jgi:23S rRNA (cytidine1920-2'-O)/16S rRNA (cytidine1409-2'-O)-methyltransferase